MMTITVEYTAQLRRATGVAREEIAVPDGAPPRVVLDAAVDRHDDLRGLVLTDEGEPHAAILVFVGDRRAGWDAPPLSDGDTVSLLSPISGG